jgi:hypothetical protein
MQIETCRAQPWYRVPLVWLIIAVFTALLAGCIAVIVMAELYADEALPVAGERLLKMPTSQATATRQQS